MIKYKRYERYKDSGVEWIGEIPEHWNVTKLGYRARMIVPMRDKPTEFNGDIPWIRIEDVDGKYIEDSKSEQRVSKELVKKMNLKVYPIGTVLCTCSCNMGTTVIVKKPLISNQTFIGIVPMKDLDSTFLYYAMNANSKRLQHLAEGAIQQYLSRHDFEHLKLAFPNENEQIAIANFLDQKTAEIDGLIADKEKLIELLQEKRQAIITEAVTKGLNPNVRMKDSGIEWIGEIPEHWKVTKLKYITNQIIDGTHNTPQYTDDGIPFLRVTDITNSRKSPINLDEVKYISEQEHKELIKRCNPKKGDLLVSKNGTIGIPKVIDWDYEFSIFVSLCLIKVNRKVNVYYCSYYFESNFINIQIAFGGKTNTITNLHLDKIREFILPLPPVEEQKIIVNYLNNRIDEIDSLIDDIQAQIQKLKEYRQSIISEAVTGKIDVREFTDKGEVI